MVAGDGLDARGHAERQPAPAYVAGVLPFGFSLHYPAKNIWLHGQGSMPLWHAKRPATIRLTGECSTAELPWNSIFSIAPVCAAERHAAPCRQHQQPRLF